MVAALYAVSVVMTVLMNYQGKPHQESKSPIKDTIEAFEFLKQENLLLGLLVLGFVPPVFGFSVTFLAPVFNHEALAGNASTLSLLISAAGFGALVGSLILARPVNIKEKGKLMFRAGYLWAISICLFSTARTVETALILISLTGLFGAIIGSLNMGLTQCLVPDHIRGRVMSIMTTVSKI